MDPSVNRTSSSVPTVHPLSSATGSETASCSSASSATADPSTTFGTTKPLLATGSSTVTWRVWPSIDTGPVPMPTAWSTSGSASTASTIPGLSPPPPNWLAAIIRSPSMTALTLSSTDDLSDPAKAVNTVTTPMPIISADAVAAVRRGERMALRRARAPGMRRNREIGAPITELAGRAATGPTATTPAAVSNAPRAAPPSAPLDAPVTTRNDTAGEHRRAGDETPPRRRRTVDRDVTQRGEWSDPRGAHCRGERCEQRDQDPDERSDDERGRLDRQTTGRQRETERVEQRLQALGKCEAEAQPDRRGDDADHDRLSGERPEHLAPIGPDRPQQRRRPLALGGDDRERVVDAERRDEQRHAREHEQEDAQEADEVGVDLVVRLVDEVVAADHFDTVGRHVGDAGDERFLADPVVGLDEQRRHAAGLARHVLFGPRQRERGERRRTETVFAAERRDPDDLDVDRLRRGDDRVIADRQVAVLGGAAVDHDLVVGHWGTSLDELVGVEVGVLDPVAGERRRAFATELLAVGARELTEALDLWLHDGNTVDLGELVGQRTVDEVLGELTVRGERVGAAHDGVGRAERRLEQRVEVGAECVAEQHRAGEQGNAETHRERCAQQPAHMGAYR